MIGVAGRTVLEDGSILAWSVADGRLGRRWRSTRPAAAARRERSVTAETAPDGRLLRLEVADGRGLLTVHPEPRGGRLHGNVVRPGGLDHLERPLPAGTLVLAGADPFAVAIALAAERRAGAGPGSARASAGPRSIILVVEGFALRELLVTVELDDGEPWRVRLGGALALEVRLGDDGLPAPGPEDARWPLERTPVGG